MMHKETIGLLSDTPAGIQAMFKSLLDAHEEMKEDHNKNRAHLQRLEAQQEKICTQVQEIAETLKENDKRTKNRWPADIQGWVTLFTKTIVVIGVAMYGCYELINRVDHQQQIAINQQQHESKQLQAAVTRIERKLGT